MDVDTYSRIEAKKESYFIWNKKTENEGQNSVNQALHVFASNKIPTDNFNITHDNEGLSNWLAYHLGL